MSWEKAMEKAIRTAGGYGIRTRVFGKKGPEGWYYWYCFAPMDRRQRRIRSW